jgi:ATP-dependent DNA ligase
MRTFGPFESSRGDNEYLVTLGDDGKIVCECKGWKMRKGDKARTCTHIKADVAKKHKFRLEARGEFTYVVDGDPILPLVDAKVQNENDGATDLEKAMRLGYVNPMLASAMKEDKTIDDYTDWIGEWKYDGERTIVAVHDDGTYDAWSRPKDGKLGKKKTLAPHIAAEIVRFPAATYDCELDPGKKGKSYNVRDLAKQASLKLAIFDILILGGFTMMDKPYTDRRYALERIFDRWEPEHVTLADTMIVSIDKVKEIWDAGGEGVILKRPESTYRPGKRSADWVKIKKAEPAVCLIVGFKAGENGPYSTVLLEHKSGIRTSCKTKNNSWLREFANNHQKYVKQVHLVIRHYGLTDTKFRGPIIWDHIAGEGEV